jgi:hypothetical protein
MLRPNGPLITGSSNLSTLQTNVMSSKSIILSKTLSTIPSGNFDSICNIDQSQGTIVVTFTTVMSPSTASGGTITLNMTTDGPQLSENSIVFLSVTNSNHVSGIPYFEVKQILPVVNGVFNGQISISVYNIDATQSINEDDYVDLSFFIVI